MVRVGILGGTFDPPHVAHISMATAARDRLGLDRVLLMPAVNPPHKPSDILSPYSQRLAMAGIAAAGIDGVEVSRFEERRPGASFTVDLLRDYGREFAGDIYFIMGSDSLRDLSTWRDPDGVLGLCTLVVFLRPGAPGAPVRLTGDAAANMIVFEEPVIDVSSTDIRSSVRAGEPVDARVNPEVLAYIREHSLYPRDD